MEYLFSWPFCSGTGECAWQRTNFHPEQPPLIGDRDLRDTIREILREVNSLCLNRRTAIRQIRPIGSGKSTQSLSWWYLWRVTCGCLTSEYLLTVQCSSTFLFEKTTTNSMFMDSGLTTYHSFTLDIFVHISLYISYCVHFTIIIFSYLLCTEIHMFYSCS